MCFDTLYRRCLFFQMPAMSVEEPGRQSAEGLSSVIPDPRRNKVKAPLVDN